MIFECRLHTDDCVVFFRCVGSVHFITFQGFHNKKTQSVRCWSRGRLCPLTRIRLASSVVHSKDRGPSKARSNSCWDCMEVQVS